MPAMAGLSDTVLHNQVAGTVAAMKTSGASSFSSSKKHALKTIWSFLASEQQLIEHVRAVSTRYFPHLRFTLLCVLVSLLFKYGSCNAQLAISVVSAAALALMCRRIWKSLRPAPCYVLDFCCADGDGCSKVGAENFRYFLQTWKHVKADNIMFQFKVYLRAGIGDEAYAPPRLLEKGESVDLEDARAETQGLISATVARLLSKTGVGPKDIDILVVNSSLFNPAPSLTAFVVNSFKMRSNIKSFSLAGMGCSAGLISIDLAKDLLRVHRDSYALVVSTENITRNMYFGNDRSMMVSNCLFRSGCSVVLLSNKPSSRPAAKLQLLHCLRTHLGADQRAYECVHHAEDDDGRLGVSLHVSLMEVAGAALRANILRLAPLILPIRELLKVGLSMARKKLSSPSKRADIKLYEPDFKTGIDHFCIHPGGRAVVDSIGKGLKLSEADIEPGKMALYRFGNTSSSGIWYAMAYCEAKGRLRKGHKVWQIALGSGFKCNSAVWKVLRDIQPWDGFGTNPWLPYVHRFPVVPDLSREYQQAQLSKLVSLASKVANFADPTTPSTDNQSPADTCPANRQPRDDKESRTPEA